MNRDEIALRFMTAVLSNTAALQSEKNRAELVTAAYAWADAFLFVKHQQEVK